MQKTLKRILSLWLILIICLGTAVTFLSHGILADAASDYYNSITATRGDALLGQVHDLITTTHTYYSSYKDCKQKATLTDAGSASDTVMEFYTHEDIPVSKWDVSGGWNREHVWCKSLSNGLWKSETVGGGSDLHHIRPSEKSLNAERGNLKYGKVSGGTPAYQRGTDNIIGGYRNSSAFEPVDHAKGDVARIVMYVYTHYNTYSLVGGTTNGKGTAGYFGTLKFTHIMSASSEEEAQKLLLEWNKSDPVDSIETTRNEQVYNIQGNRNPFIDHPEYAEAIFGDGSATPEPPVPDDPPEPLVPDDPPEPPVTGGNIEKFKNAVKSIDSAQTTQAKFTAINDAVKIYNELSQEEKQAAAAEVTKLKAAIDSYNAEVKKINSETNAQNEVALGASGGLIKGLGRERGK